MRESTLQSGDLMKATLELRYNFLTTFAFEKRREGAEITIVGCTELVPIPDVKVECIRGVIYLWREAIPVVDLGIKFGSGPAKISGGACILLTECKREKKKYKVGIILSDISDVLAIIEGGMEHFAKEASVDCSKSVFEADESCDLTEVLMNIDQIMYDIDFDSFEKMV